MLKLSKQGHKAMTKLLSALPVSILRSPVERMIRGISNRPQ